MGLASCSGLRVGSPQVPVFSLCLKLQDGARCEKAGSLKQDTQVSS